MSQASDDDDVKYIIEYYQYVFPTLFDSIAEAARKASTDEPLAIHRAYFVLSRARLAADGAMDARAGDVMAPVLGARPACRAQDHAANLDRADVLMCCAWG